MLLYDIRFLFIQSIYHKGAYQALTLLFHLLFIIYIFQRFLIKSMVKCITIIANPFIIKIFHPKLNLSIRGIKITTKIKAKSQTPNFLSAFLEL